MTAWLLFGKSDLTMTLNGALAGLYMICGLVMFNVIKGVVGLRVSAEEEMAGLDATEHGNTAYPEFGASSRS